MNCPTCGSDVVTPITCGKAVDLICWDCKDRAKTKVEAKSEVKVGVAVNG